MTQQQPTAEGLKRYPETGGYYDIPDGFFAEGAEGDPASLRQVCTCVAACAQHCEGECGCSACGWRYIVFHDMGQTYPHEFPE